MEEGISRRGNMRGIIQFFTRSQEFVDAVARETERTLLSWGRRETRFTQHVSKIIHCMIDKEYEIFDLNSPSLVYGTFDLSEMRGGDRVEIKMFATVAGRPEKLVDHWVLDNYQSVPIFLIQGIVLPTGSRLVLKLSRGEEITIGCEIFALE